MEFQELSRADLAATSKPISWIWDGLLAPGVMTLLTSQWKSGKTTLVSLLLARRAHGGTLLGRAVAPGATVIVSEEPRFLWDRRAQRLDLSRDDRFIVRPFKGKPTMEQWLALLEHMAKAHAERGVDLLVIDALATMMPVRNENFAADVLEAFEPLRDLSERGLATLVLHHPKKGQTLEGQASRGSGAKDGLVDITMEMTKVRERGGDRRRRLISPSRFEETPPRLLFEMQADGTDYLVLDETQDDEFAANWEFLRMVLEDAEAKATRLKLLADWPADFPKPAPPTLWRWLDRAVEEKRVCRDGTGRKRKPYRYWLPQKEAEWAADPMHAIRHPEPLDEEYWRDLARQTARGRR